MQQTDEEGDGAEAKQSMIRIFFGSEPEPIKNCLGSAKLLQRIHYFFNQ